VNVAGQAGPPGEQGVAGLNFLSENNEPAASLGERYEMFLDQSSMNLYQKDAAELKPSRNLRQYLGTVRTAATEAALIAALAAAVDGDTIQITANITLTATLTISKGIKLTATSKTLKITYATANQSAVTVSGDNCLVTGITIEHTGTGSNDTALSFSSATAAANCVYDAIIQTNEFGITTANAQIQIENNAFVFVGVADSHRFIFLTRTTGTTIIHNNTFSGHVSSQCILISSGDFVNGFLSICDNSSLTTVTRLMMNEANYTGANLQFLFLNNTFTCNSGFVIFYNSAALAGVSSIALQGNEMILPDGVNSKGYICIDQGGVGGTINSACRIAGYDNVAIPDDRRRTDFSDGTVEGDFTVAYLTAGFTAPSPLFTMANWVNLRKSALGPNQRFATLSSISALAAGATGNATTSAFVMYQRWCQVFFTGTITYPAASANGTVQCTIRVFKNGSDTTNSLSTSVVKNQTTLNGETTFFGTFYEAVNGSQTSASYSLNVTNNASSSAAVNISNCSVSMFFV
jgi:hypothetical protein